MHKVDYFKRQTCFAYNLSFVLAYIKRIFLNYYKYLVMFQNNICNSLLHCFWHIHWILTRLVMKLANNSSGMQKRLLISGLFPAPWWKLWKATVSVLYIFPPLQCYWQDIGSTQPVTMSTQQQIFIRYILLTFPPLLCQKLFFPGS